MVCPGGIEGRDCGQGGLLTGVGVLVKLAEAGADNRRWYQHARGVVGRVCLFWGWCGMGKRQSTR